MGVLGMLLNLRAASSVPCPLRIRKREIWCWDKEKSFVSTIFLSLILRGLATMKWLGGSKPGLALG
jgi:hypothetical protein